ncbi:MAG: FG-GAP repeat protein [Planctomycetes bacterium]|nr:FG-GAP repeat protein [Planctomycetota bacterium]
MKLALALFALAPLATAQLPCLVEETALADPNAPQGWGALDLDGDVLVAGSPTVNNHGAVSVWRRASGTWTYEALLEPPSPTSGEAFGHDVAISGDTILVGAWEANWNPYGPIGAVYVYERVNGVWVATQWLTPPNLPEFSYFGAGVAIDGDTAAVGADFAQRVFVYTRAGGTWTLRAELPNPSGGGGLFGARVALEQDVAGSTLVVTAPQASGGRAHVYTGNASAWVHQQTLSGSSGTGFGYAVDLEGDALLVGALGGLVGAVDCGAAYLFRRAGGSFALEELFTPPAPQPGQRFGQAVGLSGERLVVGAPFEDVGGTSGRGQVYRSVRVAGAWRALEALEVGDLPAPPLSWGWVTAYDGDTVVSEAGASTPALPSLRVHAPRPLLGSSFCTCSPAVCGNDAPGAGCANSTGAGARLEARGSAANGDVGLVAWGLVPGQFGIFFQGATTTQLVFGDGLLCANQPIVRLTPAAVQADAGGNALFDPCLGAPDLATAGHVQPGSGVTRHYQFWYRDPAGPCGGGFNLTNGWTITW